MNYIKEILQSRELLYNLTMREIKGKYKRTFLGQIWSLANPLAAMLVYTFVFSFVFRVNPGEGNPSGLNIFPLWLMSGLLPWIFFATVLMSGVGSLVSNGGLIQKVAFARVVLPLSTTLTAAYNWIFEMGVLVVALAIAGSWILPWLPLTLLLMLLLTLFAGGIALILSVANVYFRDTEHLMGIALQLWMYLTPIIYPVSLVAEQSARIGGIAGTPITLLGIYELNPMQSFVAAFRNVLYDNRVPGAGTLIVCTLWALLAFVIGLLVFRKNESGLGEAL